MSGFLFLLVNWVMTRWKCTSKLEDLDFADDVALISSTRADENKQAGRECGKDRPSGKCREVQSHESKSKE